MEQIKRQKHSEEFKHEAVDLVLSHGYSITEAARNLGINAGMLGRWKRERRNEVKYRFVDRHKKAWPIGLMCKVLNVSSSAYYAWRKHPESERKRESIALITLVRVPYPDETKLWHSPDGEGISQTWV